MIERILRTRRILAMVQQFRCVSTFPSYTAQDFFEAIYVDDVAMKQYLKFNTVRGAFAVSRWKDDRRTVQFIKQFKFPEAIAAILGSSTLPFEDVQTLDRSRNDEFTISSAPVLQLSVGSGFRTWIEVRVRSADEDCVVEVLSTCEAEGPWGMNDLIESCMQKETRSGIKNFLTFCETRLAKLKSVSKKSHNRSTSDRRVMDFENGMSHQISSSFFDPQEERCEGDVHSCGTGIQRIVQRMEVIEESIANQQKRHLTVIGTSVLSAVLGVSMMAMKRRQS